MPPRREKRLIIDLGHYRVIEVKRDALNISFTLALPNGTKLTAYNIPARANVSTDMALTLYTEVVLHDEVHQ